MPSIRNIAVGVVVREGRILAEEGFDAVRNRRFFRAVGGGIEFGEVAETAVRREFREELGCELDAIRLLGVVENVFEYEGRPGHEIAHVFAVTSTALAAVPLDARLTVQDTGSIVRWLPIGELGTDRPLYPDGTLRLVAAAQLG